MNENTIEGFRLSPSQRRVWQLQQSENSQFYQTLGGVLIEGKLDGDVLKQALRTVVERNEILRTTFQWLPGMTVPIQVVNNDIPILFEEYDFQESDADKQSAQIEAVILKLRQHQVDYAKEPHWRACLVTLSPNRHKLFIVASAICLDATSITNLAQEISYGYAAILSGEELPDNTMQFADIAEWQNQLLESDEAETGKDYWRAQPIPAVSDFRLSFEKNLDNRTFKPEKLTKRSNPKYLPNLKRLPPIIKS